jgi:Predicted membrane protein (DUF2306)
MSFHVDLQKKNSPAGSATRRLPLILTIIATLLFVTYTGIRAVFEAWDNDGFPEALAVKLELLPIIFPVHMVSGGLSLLLVPATILLRKTPFHKILGRITATDILLAGVTAPFVAWAMPVTIVSAAGFTAQAIVWMGLLFAGIWNIRSGRIAAHQTCMILIAAVTSGALFFRILLALWVLFGDHHYFNQFYALSAWIAWGLPLLATYVFHRVRGKKGAQRTQ